jgi:hypothetical protein
MSAGQKFSEVISMSRIDEIRERAEEMSVELAKCRDNEGYYADHAVTSKFYAYSVADIPYLLAELDKARGALEVKNQALNDAIIDYARDMCSEEMINEMRERIQSAGSWMVYLGNAIKAGQE